LRFDNVPSGWSDSSTERFSGWDIIATQVPKLKIKLSGRTPVLVSLYVKFYVPIQHFWDFG
jgi:hypothetical protein